ncbi:type II secretion system protein N [Frateuria sp. Soil773]|uniref:type II secretion system protein N n=1 Tax=Frateuria sp. Soil773 TaxID=1736407 RepID=UPI000ADB8D3E|nr:type II secretion system protein N [Frateuria sp. Soil773]
MVLLASGLLAWFLPARWAVAWIGPRLHGIRLEQVHGSVWDGRAGQVLGADGRAYGSLRWRLSRRALLGDMRLRLDLDGPSLDFGGELRRPAADRLAWRDVRVRADLAELAPPQALSLGQPQGVLAVQAPEALTQGGWPLQLRAQAQWRDAGLRTHNGEVALGNLQFEAEGDDGLIRTQMHDDGHGPLALEGRLEASPLGWRLDATLRPRGGDPALRRWLATLGQPAADGSLYLRRQGGLALPAGTARP